MIEGTIPEEDAGVPDHKPEVVRADESDSPVRSSYSIFTAREKWSIVALAAIAGLFRCD